MSKFRFEWKRNCEENGIWNLEKSAGDTKREIIKYCDSKWAKKIGINSPGDAASVSKW